MADTVEKISISVANSSFFCLTWRNKTQLTIDVSKDRWVPHNLMLSRVYYHFIPLFLPPNRQMPNPEVNARKKCTRLCTVSALPWQHRFGSTSQAPHYFTPTTMDLQICVLGYIQLLPIATWICRPFSWVTLGCLSLCQRLLCGLPAVGCPAPQTYRTLCCLLPFPKLPWYESIADILPLGDLPFHQLPLAHIDRCPASGRLPR